LDIRSLAMNVGSFSALESCLTPATHTTETGTNRLVPETCTCVSQSGTSFWHGIEHSSIPSQKLWGTWHEPCNVIGRIVLLVQETVTMNFLCKFLVPVSGAYVASVSLWDFTWCRWRTGPL